MCGITGFLGEAIPADDMRATALRMTYTLRHRGPDDFGVWVDAQSGIALGQRRLSIIDLSPSGHQPMRSASDRYIIVFNGEIYNFRELRRELDAAGAAPAVSRSDTEVILAGAEMWGLEGCLARLNGMFAFALWDRHERTLFLARDRFGEKPLYYGWIGHNFLFGSELKALAAHPDFRPNVDLGALALFLRHNCIPAPYSVYHGIRKLPPGQFLAVHWRRRDAAPRPYWTLREAVEKAQQEPFRGTEREAVDELECLLRDSVRLRMISDVPLGAFLSGGVDSPTITALMQAASDRPVRTFTVGLTNVAYHEAADARAIAAHLGTDHTELLVTPEEAMAVIPQLPQLYDEPFADSSQIPTHLVARLARQHVTVALSGDGGDEVFAGYNRHCWVKRIWNKAMWIPRPMRRTMAALLTGVSTERWDRIFGIMAPALPSQAQARIPGYKLHKLAAILGSASPSEMYLGLASHWNNPGSMLAGAAEPETLLTQAEVCPAFSSFAERMMFLDTVTYLPDDILVKVDRATMAVGLEARVPFLDHRVVEFAWRLPMALKIRDNVGKWILRQVLYRYVPAALMNRPKMGFGIPLDTWLRGPLRAWAESLLETQRLCGTGLDPNPIRSLWAQHLAGRGNWQFHLWDVLMLQAWMEQWRQSPVAHRVGVGESDFPSRGNPASVMRGQLPV
jgi:asparagine synthase (glutamine-hydrolysing)